MQDLYQRQIQLEEEYSTASIAAGQQAVMDAFKQGRAADVGAGRLLLAKAHEAAVGDFTEFLSKPMRGNLGKYKTMLKHAPVDILVMAGLREVINACASVDIVPMQKVLQDVGRVIETESMLVYLEQVNPTYTQRTIEYLDSAGTKSTNHRYRTLLAGSQNIGLNWNRWSMEERVGVARLLLRQLYESTGLFRWVQIMEGKEYIIRPSDALEKHFNEVQAAARAVVRYPPMLIKPNDWVSQYDGGYLSEWFRIQAPMCGLRYMKKEQRDWIVDGLQNARSAPVRSAMSKAQSTPYRVNKEVLEVLRQALSTRLGILGLPSTQAKPQPQFPFPKGWLKDEATEEELQHFKLWKAQMREWYTAEAKRTGRKAGILSRLSELVRYKDEAELYFPTFIDWRGRMYFRSNLNPQSSDAVKGCLEFARGKRLGAEGLFWLKVHVANSCGYDKHSPEIKAQWTDDNWEMIRDFINNPLDVDAPEPDTAFTLLQAGLALQAAFQLPNPCEYICHTPVAMDATCSGLQHLSALTRDPTGAYYTNLVDNQEDKKSDIYVHVAELAEESKETYIQDDAVSLYWKETPISRTMAKRPVMTYVYGSTLLTTVDNIALDMAESGMEPIRTTDGRLAYSFNKLAIPIGKALRKGVQDTVPMATEMMNYLQLLVRRHKEHTMQWITPVGVPVINWAEGQVVKLVQINSMGVVGILMSYRDGKYNTRAAANGIVPNFVHSMDSAHLCMTINAFDGDILPIHDSFATHPSDVASMHRVLRQEFVKMYSYYDINSLLIENGISQEDYAPPEQGTFDLYQVLQAPHMFG